MVTMLTQVWKAAHGAFFETEQEAIDAEINWKVDAAITAAFEKIKGEEAAKLRQDYRRLRSEDDWRCTSSTLRVSAYSEEQYVALKLARLDPPAGFQAALVSELRKCGVLDKGAPK